MKNLLLILLPLMLSLATFAQREDEYYMSRNNDDVILQQNNSKNLFNPDHLSGRSQETFVSPTFDPVWADRFQTVLDSSIAALGIKGASAAFYIPGHGTWTGVTGISSENEPITEEMRFGIASNTKLFVAVVLAKLQEEGILSLDDQLDQWLPDYPNVDPAITIRQLLLHQNGLFDYSNDNWSMPDDSVWADTSRFWTAEEVVASIGEPHFEAGTGYRYSNTGYVLAGMVVESATGKSWVQNMREIIFDPLVLDSTFVGAYESRNGPVATQYFAWNDNLEVPNCPVTAVSSMSGAAGSIFSTPLEMVGWYHKLFNNEVLTEIALDEILDTEYTSSYGLGISEFELIKNEYIYYHTGGGEGYISMAGIDQRSGAVFFVVTNSRQTDGVWHSIYSIAIPLLEVMYDEYPKKSHDAGIRKINAPWEIHCNTIINPQVELKNFGSEMLTSVEINYQIDEGDPMIFQWTGQLNTGETEEVYLPEINTVEGKHQFISYTSNPNGGEEGYAYNDRSESNFLVNSYPSEITLLSESFDNTVFPPDSWSLSSSSIHQWDQTSLCSYSGDGCAAKSSARDIFRGGYYDLNLPKLNISEGSSVKLDFTYAYNMVSPYRRDTLQIFASDDCGSSWQMVFERGGHQLRTYYVNSGVLYYPRTADEWRYISIPLDNFTGDILIKFRMISDNSNNFFMDDVNVSMFTSTESLVSAKKIKVFPNPVSNSFRISGLPENSEFQLCTLSGQVLLKGLADKEITTIIINDLPRGVYILRTTLGTEKIVKL